jgi:hypothetical protein
MPDGHFHAVAIVVDLAPTQSVTSSYVFQVMLSAPHPQMSVYVDGQRVLQVDVLKAVETYRVWCAKNGVKVPIPTAAADAGSADSKAGPAVSAEEQMRAALDRMNQVYLRKSWLLGDQCVVLSATRGIGLSVDSQSSAQPHSAQARVRVRSVQLIGACVDEAEVQKWSDKPVYYHSTKKGTATTIRMATDEKDSTQLAKSMNAGTHLQKEDEKKKQAAGQAADTAPPPNEFKLDFHALYTQARAQLKAAKPKPKTPRDKQQFLVSRALPAGVTVEGSGCVFERVKTDLPNNGSTDSKHHFTAHLKLLPGAHLKVTGLSRFVPPNSMPHEEEHPPKYVNVLTLRMDVQARSSSSLAA